MGFSYVIPFCVCSSRFFFLMSQTEDSSLSFVVILNFLIRRDKY